MDLGTYIEYAGRPAVRFERTYPHPVERVWAAVTEPSDLAAWFPSAVTIEDRVGGTVTFSDDPHLDDSTGVVLGWEPPRHVSYTWGEDELHFDLAESEGGCRLVLVNVLGDRSAAARNAAGWTVCLAELDKALAGRPGGGPHSDDTEPWQPYYEAYQAAGFPSGADIPSA